MPTSASIWSDDTWAPQNADLNDGRFIATLTYSDTITFDGLPQLTQYEHGYVDGEYSPAEGATGIAQEAGNGNVTFASVFSPTASGNVSGSYYLTEDIWVSGFSGKTMTSGAVLDGNGHTIYISGLAQPVENYGAADIGGIVGNMNGGTIKNLRIVIVGDYALQTKKSKDESVRALGFGLVAGRMQNNATIENVTVVLQGNVSVNETDTTALGGVSGNLSGNATIKNVTVQLDGNLSCTATYPFVAGFVGNTDSGSSGTYTNIILKGSGTFGGNATNAGDEPLFTAAITILPGSGSAPLATIDGFIYALTADNPVSASSYSSYGYVSQNLANDNIANPGDGKPADGYVAYSNIFAVTTMTPYYSGPHAGNTYIAMKTTATITPEVQGASGSRVTPYFVPGSTTDITLVATAGDWNGITRLQTNGSDKGDLRPASNGTIVVTAAKSKAYADGTITLSEYVAATVQISKDSVQYTGGPADFGITVTVGDSTLTLDKDYTISYAGDTGTTYPSAGESAPTYVGSYIITVKLINDDMFEGNGGNLTSSKQISVTIIRADLPNTVTVSIKGWTYGHYDADTNTPSVSSPEGFGAAGVTYVYYNSDDAVISEFDPAAANAGTYYVAAQIEQTANYNDGTTARVPFIIEKAPLTDSEMSFSLNKEDGQYTYGDTVSITISNSIEEANISTKYEQRTDDGGYVSVDTAPKSAGKYRVTLSVTGATNYEDDELTADFTIAPKALTFTATLEVDAKITYGDVLSAEALKNLVKIECSDTPAYDDDYTVTVEATGYSEDTPADTEIALTVTVSFDERIAANYSVTQPEASALRLKVQKGSVTTNG